MEAELFKIKVTEDGVPGGGSRSGLQSSTFSLCLHMVERKERSGPSFPSYNNTNLVMRPQRNGHY